MPLPTSLVVKNGSKMRGRISGAMPQPVSVTRQADEAPGRGLGIAVGAAGVHVHGRGVDDQPAAVGHGVAGVDGQVHQHLLDHAGVGVDQRRRGCSIGLQRECLRR